MMWDNDSDDDYPQLTTRISALTWAVVVIVYVVLAIIVVAVIQTATLGGGL